MMYDVCIVGAGLWGSAAARYASKDAKRKVCLVGPSEPKADEEQDETRNIFSSHYDSGRNVRKYQGYEAIPTQITMGAFESLKELEKTAGISFFRNAGFLYFGQKTMKIINSGAIPAEHSQTCKYLKSSEVSARFPFLNTSHIGEGAMLFQEDAGLVNPRMLLAAQHAVARSQGCDIVEAVVESVKEARDGTMEVHLADGETIRARKVLLCAGAFINFKKLLPAESKLDIMTGVEFAVLLEVAEDDQERLSTMPTMASSTDYGKNCYILPPVKYPDGKTYIKIGPFDALYYVPLTSLEAVKAWYHSSPDPKLVEKFKNILLSIMIDFSPKSVRTKLCCDAITPTGLPYCDMVSPGLGLATGGNSYGAMVSEGMGRMAADMITGVDNWSGNVPVEMLKAQYFKPSSN